MAKQINPFQEDAAPPFAGFPKDAIRFLRQLKKNNTRDWFVDNKEWFERSLRAPMESLLGGLAERLRSIDPDIVIEPKKSMYRIYRDVRFSADKTPYKTHVAAAFTCRGFDRKTDAAFYFHIADNEVGVGGGLYSPSSDQLKRLRTAIARDAKPLRAILAGKTFKKYFVELQGEELTRVPAGYEKDHPDADLLRLKQFLCWAVLDTDTVFESEFLDTLLLHIRAMAPFIRYLVDHS